MIQIINVIGKQGYHKIMNENFYIYSLLPAKSISRILVLPLHLTTATTTWKKNPFNYNPTLHLKWTNMLTKPWTLLLNQPGAATFQKLWGVN